MGWGAAEAVIMEVVQALVDEEGESAERALGVDLSEVQFQIVRAAHVVVAGAHMATMELMEAVKAPAEAAGSRGSKGRVSRGSRHAAEAPTAEAAKAPTSAGAAVEVEEIGGSSSTSRSNSRV